VSGTCEYFRANSVEEAVALLGQHEGAKVLAGGQSLIPMLAMRLARPTALIDVGRIPALDHVRREGDRLVIGALVRHRDIAGSPVVREACPLLADAAAEIGHAHIRNRGTIGGSLAHADPAAEYLTAGLAVEASVQVVGRQGARELRLDELVVGPLTTCLAADELLTEVRVPVPPPGTGWSFRELALRKGDFALVQAAVLLRCDGGGLVEDVRVAIGAATAVPVRCRETERRLRGQPFTDDLAARAGGWAAGELTDPVSDIHAPGDYRVEVAGVLVRDALRDARSRGGR
jgi:CO/xanthine dehydrogenase FAD-binding subunit